jgi:isopenicillin-N epimerase
MLQEPRLSMKFGPDMRAHWALDPGVTYLNHGTVGAVPKRVLAAQQAIRDEIERQPSLFLLREVAGLVGGPREAPTRMRLAARDVAAFIGAEEPDVVFVDNATTGVNAVLRSFPIASGDELLLTDHNYGATAKIAAFVARERHAHVRTVQVPYPAFNPGQLVDAITAAIGPRTRIAVIDHVTSETGLVFPLAEIARRCRDRGVAILADGAHAPGMLALDVPALGVDWYTANLHKWAHAPRSCGILWARRDRQAGLHPPVISWGLDTGFTAEFDWVGTRDPSPWLAAPEGVRFLDELGFADVRRYNHSLVWTGAARVCEAWGTRVEVAAHDIGSMIVVPLPAGLGSAPADAARVRDALLFEDRIEVQVHARQNRLWARLSAQIYNDPNDFERLARAVTART